METTKETVAPFGADAELDLMNAVCAALRAIPLGAKQTMPFDAAAVRRAIGRHMGRNARVLYYLTTDSAGRPVVERSNRPAIPPLGRPMESGATLAYRDLHGIKAGESRVLFGHSRENLNKASARLRRITGAVIRLAYNGDAARATRVDGIFTTDGYGNAIDMAELVERTPYPFRAMKPGDRFTATEDAHGGIESMRSICSKFSKRIGHTFKAAPNQDGSITVTCLCRDGVWYSERRHNEVQEKLKHQAPWVISEIWQ